MIVYVNTANKGTLNLRQSTSTSSAVLAQIPNGTKLEAEKVNEAWVKITYKDKTGFAMLKYLSEGSTNSTMNKEDLQRIYDSLKSTLSLIENILK